MITHSLYRVQLPFFPAPGPVMNSRNHASRLIFLLLFITGLLAATACEPAHIIEATPERNEQPGQSAPAEETDKTLPLRKKSQLKRVQPGARQQQIMRSIKQQAERSPKCPMAVRGTHPTAVRLDGAGAIDFITDGDVAELRRQVQKKVIIHQDNHIEPGQMPALNAAMLEKMSPAQRKQVEKQNEIKRLMGTSMVVGEEIDGGMRVKLTPGDPAEMDALFVVIQDHADGLEAAGPICPGAKQRGHVPQQK